MSIVNVRYGDRNATCCAATEDYVYFTYSFANSTSYVTDKNLVHLSSTSTILNYTTLRMVAQDNQNVYRNIGASTERLYYNGSILSLGQRAWTGSNDHKMSFELSNNTHLWMTSGNYEIYLIDINSYVPPNNYGYLYASIKNAKNICCTNNHICLGYDDRIEYYTYSGGSFTLRGTIYQTGQYQFLYNSNHNYLYVATGSGIVAIEATGSVDSPTLTVVDSISGNFTGLATRGDYLVALYPGSNDACIYKISNNKLVLIDIYTSETSVILPTVNDIYGNDIFLCRGNDVPVKIELSSNPLGVINQQLIY